MAEIGTMRVKSGLAQMLKGGVIMDVTTADQARVAEEAGACAVMALERIPAAIRAVGVVAGEPHPRELPPGRGVARMDRPELHRGNQGGGPNPVKAKGPIRPLLRA